MANKLDIYIDWEKTGSIIVSDESFTRRMKEWTGVKKYYLGDMPYLDFAKKRKSTWYGGYDFVSMPEDDFYSIIGEEQAALSQRSNNLQTIASTIRKKMNKFQNSQRQTDKK